MKPHPRPPIIRKTIKWGGAAVTVLLVVVWIGSINRGWAWFGSMNGWTTRIVLIDGAIGYAAVQSPPPTWPLSGWFYAREMFQPRVWWFSLLSRSQDVNLVIPIWPVTLAAASAMLVAWRVDALARRREAIGKCPKCGYDRTGLARGAKCPECGAVPAGV